MVIHRTLTGLAAGASDANVRSAVAILQQREAFRERREPDIVTNEAVAD